MLSHTLLTEVEIRRNDGSLHSHIETLKGKVLKSRVVPVYEFVLKTAVILWQQRHKCAITTDSESVFPTVSQRVLSSDTLSMCTCCHPPTCPSRSPRPGTPSDRNNVNSLGNLI